MQSLLRVKLFQGSLLRVFALFILEHEAQRCMQRRNGTMAELRRAPALVTNRDDPENGGAG